tara:strand:+ start:653 stop:772 length:120 start_codon:yes stop_codon:yes gene_type:complete
MIKPSDVGESNRGVTIPCPGVLPLVRDPDPPEIFDEVGT